MEKPETFTSDYILHENKKIGLYRKVNSWLHYAIYRHIFVEQILWINKGLWLKPYKVSNDII